YSAQSYHDICTCPGRRSAFDATVDILLVRPVSFAATIVGTAVFIVSLPFSIPSKSVGTTAKTLVADPFNFTFTRPVGVFNEREMGRAEKREMQSPSVEEPPRVRRLAPAVSIQ
ncbi:MAG TPA: hypothetical protein VLZ07_12390, partial [Syntrophales bacterium]|nr:hypothetical protein [Syntrophales bacterium]